MLVVVKTYREYIVIYLLNSTLCFYLFLFENNNKKLILNLKIRLKFNLDFEIFQFTTVLITNNNKSQNFLQVASNLGNQ